MTYYVYVDRTLDGRIFYVGKGNDGRIVDVDRRNRLWKSISKRFGFERLIVFETFYEPWALDREVELIDLFRTFVGRGCYPNAWGANLTRGGEGSSGWHPSVETRQKMSLNHKGHLHSDATKAKMRVAQIGKSRPHVGVPRSSEARKRISCALKGRRLTQEHINARSVTNIGKPHRCGLCHESGHHRTTCPKRSTIQS